MPGASWLTVDLIAAKFPGLEPEDIAARPRCDTFVHLDKRYLYFAVPRRRATR